ncbi:MAG: hypothetical protein JNK64_26430 [Myxococcales bacterium]|nr:hypothetical protein [Myxococcales bacterium]
MGATDRRAINWATGLLALAMAVMTFTGPRGLLGGDEGVKLIQTFGVLEYGLDDPRLPYPAGEFDPTERNQPVVAPHVVIHDGHRYGIYPITFTAASAVAWRVGGFWGLHVLPWLGGVLAVLMTMRLALLVTGDRRWAIAAGVAVVVASPVAIYAALFNEHAPAVGLFLAGVVGCATATSRNGQLAAGATLGLAATFRPELIAAIPAVAWFVVAYHGASRATLHRVSWIGLGAGAVLAAFCLYNVATTGAALPGVTANRAINQPRNRMVMMRLLFEPRFHGAPPPLVALALTLAVGALAWWRRIPRPWLWRAAVVTGALWCWCAAAALARVAPGIGPFRTATGLFSTAPFLIIAALVGLVPDATTRRRAVATAGAGWLLTLAVCATSPDGQAGGLQFGGRHVLAAVPLLTVAAIAVVRAMPRWTAALAAVPAALAVWATVQNVRAWHVIAGHNQALTEAAARSPSKDLCSNFFWGPEVLAPLWMERRISLADDMAGPLDRMRAAGVTEITQVLGGLEGFARTGRLAPIETLDAKRNVIRYRIVR